MQVPYLAGPRPDTDSIIACRMFEKANWANTFNATRSPPHCLRSPSVIKFTMKLD